MILTRIGKETIKEAFLSVLCRNCKQFQKFPTFEISPHSSQLLKFPPQAFSRQPVYRIVQNMETGTAGKDAIGRILGESLENGIRDGIFPGGVAAWRDGNGTALVARGALRWLGTKSATEAVTTDTAYDLASLTKVVSTLPLVMLAVAAGRLSLDDSADGYLPELKTGAGRTWNHAITIRNLLSHSSGLPAWRPYFVRLRGKEAYLSAIADENPSYASGTAVEYSDLGFMLLGWILERAWDEDLATLARRHVFGPLGMATTGYLPGINPTLKGKTFAPTEHGNLFERGMALAYAERRSVIGGFGPSYPLEPADLESLPWRDRVIEGEAHDVNCHYGLGGVSGHAGLFSTAGDLLRYCAFWDECGMIHPRLRLEAFGRQTPPGSIARGLGWLLDGDGTAHHTGFTGTSLRYTPGSGIALIALTNRVHPAVRDGIGPWRLALATALAGYAKPS